MSVATNIYSLRDELGVVRYIGKTSRSLQLRLTQHLYVARTQGNPYHRDRWIRRMIESGNKPVIHLIERVPGDGCREEIHWIAFLRRMDWPITNTTEGGEGVTGLKHSEETKRLWSIARLGKTTGKPIHPNAKKAFREANVGKPKSIAHKAAISATLKGRIIPEAVKDKIRKAMIGRIFTPEWKRKISEARTGIKHTSAAKEKMRAAKLGRKLTPEHRSKIRVAMKKRRLTEKHKLNISEAYKRRKQQIMVGPKT